MDGCETTNAADGGARPERPGEDIRTGEILRRVGALLERLHEDNLRLQDHLSAVLINDAVRDRIATDLQRLDLHAQIKSDLARFFFEFACRAEFPAHDPAAIADLLSLDATRSAVALGNPVRLGADDGAGDVNFF